MLGPDAAKLPFQHRKKRIFFLKNGGIPTSQGFLNCQGHQHREYARYSERITGNP